MVYLLYSYRENMIQNIIGLITCMIFSIILLESILISELYGQDLAIDERVNITVIEDNNNIIQTIPANIGIEPNLWNDHSLDNYSYDPNNIAPLNTKKYDGVIHIESIYDREFTLEDFLDIWGFNKSKIIDVFVDNKNPTKDYRKVFLADGQNIKLVIKQEKISDQNFANYNGSKIFFKYPSEWNLPNSFESQNKYHSQYESSSNEQYYNLIQLFPSEFHYMTTPLFYIQITELNSNMTIDRYYNENIHKVLQANETTFPKLINKSNYVIDSNSAVKINLNTSLVAEPGVKDAGNQIYQSSLHIWTIKDGYFYDISFQAFQYAYPEYISIINKIIKSIRIE